MSSGRSFQHSLWYVKAPGVVAASMGPSASLAHQISLVLVYPMNLAPALASGGRSALPKSPSLSLFVQSSHNTLIEKQRRRAAGATSDHATHCPLSDNQPPLAGACRPSLAFVIDGHAKAQVSNDDCDDFALAANLQVVHSIDVAYHNASRGSLRKWNTTPLNPKAMPAGRCSLTYIGILHCRKGQTCVPDEYYVSGVGGWRQSK